MQIYRLIKARNYINETCSIDARCILSFDLNEQMVHNMVRARTMEVWRQKRTIIPVSSTQFLTPFHRPSSKVLCSTGKNRPKSEGGGDVLAYLRGKSTKASTTSKQASSGLKKAKPHVTLSPNPLMDALDWLPPSIFITKNCIDIKIKICSLVSEKLQSWTKGLEKKLFYGRRLHLRPYVKAGPFDLKS